MLWLSFGVVVYEPQSRRSFVAFPTVFRLERLNLDWNTKKGKPPLNSPMIVMMIINVIKVIVDYVISDKIYNMNHILMFE